ELLARARPAVEQRRRRRAPERATRRLALATLPHPRRLRALVPLLEARERAGPRRRLPDAASLLVGLVPAYDARIRSQDPIPPRTPARSEPPRGRAALLLGCVQRVFFGEVHRATIEVLAAEGYDVLAPRLPDCCGALERQAGEQRAALGRAQQTIEAFSSLGG